MNWFYKYCFLGILIFSLTACNPTKKQQLETPIIDETTTEEILQANSPSPTLLKDNTRLLETQVPSFMLSKPGPYFVGSARFTLKDSKNQNRKVDVKVWYPTTKTTNSTDNQSLNTAPPDKSNAPYPLILSSSKVANIFGDHMASYGFIVIGVYNMDSSNHWGAWLIDYPKDILFTLDQISSNSPKELEGMIDSDHVGTMGYSFDGYNSLALSGARIDPQFYLARCGNPEGNEPAPPAWWIDYICNLNLPWDEFVSHAESIISDTSDGLWKPITDDRIRAVMPMAPEGAWLFGERGLSATDRPTLIIGASKDDINIYDFEAKYIFNHIGTSKKILITFIGKNHFMIYDSVQVARMKHFATAFFGYYLLGQEDYAQYFSEDFVSQFNDLAWGNNYNK